jgi:endonuclease YncB( thermonuclease family)
VIIPAISIATVLAVAHYQGFLPVSHDAASRGFVLLLPALIAWGLRAYKAVSSGVSGVPLPCDLVRVVDGDTAIVNHMGNRITIRLQAIDCPESDQPYGDVAQDTLHSILTSGALSWIGSGDSTYGRGVAALLVDGADVGLQMVSSGFAWPSELQYLPPTEYLEAHKRAREEKRGLFKDKNPIHPAQWRNKKKDTLAAKVAADEARIRAMIEQQA